MVWKKINYFTKKVIEVLKELKIYSNHIKFSNLISNKCIKNKIKELSKKYHKEMDEIEKALLIENINKNYEIDDKFKKDRIDKIANLIFEKLR